MDGPMEAGRTHLLALNQRIHRKGKGTTSSKDLMPRMNGVFFFFRWVHLYFLHDDMDQIPSGWMGMDWQYGLNI